LLYVEHESCLLNLRLIFLTALAMVSRRRALRRLGRLVAALGGNEALCAVARREGKLTPHPPPGADEVVTQR